MLREGKLAVMQRSFVPFLLSTPAQRSAPRTNIAEHVAPWAVETSCTCTRLPRTSASTFPSATTKLSTPYCMLLRTLLEVVPGQDKLGRPSHATTAGVQLAQRLASPTWCYKQGKPIGSSSTETETFLARSKSTFQNVPSW